MSAKAVNVNDIIDRAKFSGFHFQVVAWCLLIILFDGYDLAINGVALLQTRLNLVFYALLRVLELVVYYRIWLL